MTTNAIVLNSGSRIGDGDSEIIMTCGQWFYQQHFTMFKLLLYEIIDNNDVEQR